MKALVISGGGSKGAFAGGIAEHLIVDKKKDYDLFVGTSTGSLLSPMLASGNLKKAKEVYTNITPKDIFTLNPYKTKTKHGVSHIQMNHFNILRSFLRGNKTFGSSKKLRKTISKFFTEEDFNNIRLNNKQVITTVSNLSLQQVEYKSTENHQYKDFCDWTWASANFLPFMSLMKKDRMEYGDGGFANNIPVQAAINAGAKEIDVIILDPTDRLTNRMPSVSSFDLTLKVFDFLLEQNNINKLELSALRPQNSEVKVNRYYTPNLLTENSLVFNKDQMQKWWQEGKEFATGFTPRPAILTAENESLD